MGTATVALSRAWARSIYAANGSTVGRWWSVSVLDDPVELDSKFDGVDFGGSKLHETFLSSSGTVTMLADLFSILLESPAMAIETYTAQVESIKNLTHDVRQLNLRLIEPRTIMFKPGQFISFEMPDPQTGRLLTRAYSIASQPSRAGVITLLFNLVSGGPGSSFLFHLKAGEKTHFKGPAGHFYLRDDPERELLFVASGTGIAPIRSMLLANAECHNPRPATLFWGLRSQQDLYDQEELDELTKRTPTFTAVTTLSRPDPGWSGESGRVLRLIEERITSVRNLAVYLCGNSAMIADATSLLQKKGLCPIYREKYYDGEGDGG